jgi:uncharacterized membrane protein YkvA (DUF1232 family)
MTDPALPQEKPRQPPERATARQVITRVMRLPLAHRFRLAVRLARNPRVPWRGRLPLAVLLCYLAAPIDIVPDFIPVIGQLDDVLVAGVAVWWFLRVCPPDVALEEIARLERTPPGPLTRLVSWLSAALAAALVALLLVWWLRR